MKIRTYSNQTIEVDIDYSNGNLMALPAFIDPHVHFRTPGYEYKENWKTGAKAAIAGGVTTVFDMPNTKPAMINEQLLFEKKSFINEQLRQADIALNYKLWFGATLDNLNEIEVVKNEIVGIKLFMGSSTGDLLVDKKEDQIKIFELAGQLNLPVAVHAENEEIIKKNKVKFNNAIKAFVHSQIRDRKAAQKSVDQAIELADKYNTKLYILHASTKEEIEIIRQGKKSNIQVLAEVTPHHLFLTENDYDLLDTKLKMNPPVRTLEDQDALWDGILDGVVDTIGTDHAPHTLEEKNKPYWQCPSGVPGIETCLPLLLDARHKGRISIEKIVELTRTNAEKIFNLKKNDDWVVVDLDLEREVKNKNLKTKCGWSPFAGRKLKGWPIVTILNNKKYYS